jgi:hypothetical protein
MRAWWFIPSRSLRRQANRTLAKRSGVSAARRTWQAAGIFLARPGWRFALAVSLAVHSVFVAGLLGDNPPEWLDTAWQVSGGLIGLGVALIVFILQAAAAQSIGSQPAYSALINYTGLVWAAALSLVFLAAVGFLERFGDPMAATSGWADTWALIVFCMQVAAFGGAFARTLRIVSPGGVASVVQRAFAHELRAGAKSSLRRRLIETELRRVCEEANIGSVYMPGHLVFPRRPGRVHDVDRLLPVRLARLGLRGGVALYLYPGREVGLDGPLAEVGGVRGEWLDRIVRRGVDIRPGGPETSDVMVFDDVLDFARRSLATGSPAAFRDALKVVVQCLSEMPEAYRWWGVGYSSENVGEASARVPEQQLFDNLGLLFDDAIESGEPTPILFLPRAAHLLVVAGLNADAPLFVAQATLLWRRLLGRGFSIANDDLRTNFRSSIDHLGAEAVKVWQERLEDRSRPLSVRLGTQEGLKRLFMHQIDVMRMNLKSGDINALVDNWHHWLAWTRDFV